MSNPQVMRAAPNRSIPLGESRYTTQRAHPASFIHWVRMHLSIGIIAGKMGRRVYVTIELDGYGRM